VKGYLPGEANARLTGLERRSI